METVGAPEANAHLAELLERVPRGEEFTITEHGKPVARLVPVLPSKPRAEVQRAIEQLKAFAQGNTPGEDLTIRDMIKEGRRF